MSEPIWRERPGGFEIQPAREGATRIREFIWLSEGLSNAWLVQTPAGRVVINTGMGFEGPIHKRNFDAIDPGPVRYVIFTQGHVDHVGGVDPFLEEGTQVVAQAGNAAHQADDARIAAFRARRSAFAFGDAIRKASQYIREHLGEEMSPQSVPRPTITFQDRLDFELGGVRFELLATPGGETKDSLVVWLPQQGACFTGNLFSALFGHFPNLVTVRGDRYRDALAFVESAERVLALEPELLLVGHHQPVVGRARIREEIERVRDAVRYVHDETLRYMNRGDDVYTAMREIALPAKLAVGEGYGKVAWSVRAIWETYAGWFHQRSTTELYATPPESIHPELVALAGGPEPVAARAKACAEKGRTLEAIHLAEVVLGAAPGHRGALAASRAAHCQLLEASQNFWETAWLRREIARIDGVLEAQE